MAKRKITLESKKLNVKSASKEETNGQDTTNNIEKVELEEKPKKSFQIDAYESSDEEDLRNTIGNIPLEWYDEYNHVGYDKDGQPILKSEKQDEIDNFLDRMENPDYWRKIRDPQTGKEHILTNEELEKIKNITEGKFEIGYNPYEKFYDLCSSNVSIHPIDNRPDDKRSFIPSLTEKKLVSKMVYAIKMGWRKPWSVQQKEKEEKKEQVVVYDLWSEPPNQVLTKMERWRIRNRLDAPKCALPVHNESYNPPTEYLFDEKELADWEKTEPEMRKQNYIPVKYDSLRKVPFYENFYNERAERCLDLACAPRKRKERLNIDPSMLLPNLPDPKDLQPFPTKLSFYMRGHTGQVRTISVEPETGELLASGGADGTVKIWSIVNGRCLRTFKMGAPVTCVAFCPDPSRTLILVSCENNKVSLVNTQCGDKLLVSKTSEYLKNLDINNDEEDDIEDENDDAKGGKVKWTLESNGNIDIILNNKIKQVVWHAKGDYFSTVSFENSNDAVYIHQLSKAKSQKPFSKKKGSIQAVLFHPREPTFFVCTQQHVRVYDLAKCVLQKKLSTGTRWASCVATEPFGNNLFVGGLDCRFAWLDMQLSRRPWKMVRHHKGAIRGIAYHRYYPLLATVSDDSFAFIYHANAPDDLMAQNELIPVKKLRGHKCDGNLSILNCVFHPIQPWLITAGADGQIGVFTY
ncbi:Ribosome biogenesis protein bop1 [Strongyloides ratti]|uniref:Ribosome biogenesis protein BOP1 homolog n=1 Tax=Strongyloides ratti TaxID=34506 RepID=A0A090LJT5_STRRB|nr:Ribosome biogenesis protein bop1 [Strongyloides ratti]CEF67780.1 Ribosome biogenesis protein bop1 [Strongyloides ratti]